MFLNTPTYADAFKMSLSEYTWKMSAFVEREKIAHEQEARQAWLNFVVQATDEKGKAVYATLDKFTPIEIILTKGENPNRNDQINQWLDQIRRNQSRLQQDASH